MELQSLRGPFQVTMSDLEFFSEGSTEQLGGFGDFLVNVS